jgi:importin subunit alpha-6/7
MSFALFSALLRNAVWTLSNFVRGSPPASLEKIQPMLPACAVVLQRCDDKEVVTDIGWTLSYASDGDDARLQALVDAGLVPLVAQVSDGL